MRILISSQSEFLGSWVSKSVKTRGRLKATTLQNSFRRQDNCSNTGVSVQAKRLEFLQFGLCHRLLSRRMWRWGRPSVPFLALLQWFVCHTQGECQGKRVVVVAFHQRERPGQSQSLTDGQLSEADEGASAICDEGSNSGVQKSKTEGSFSSRNSCGKCKARTCFNSCNSRERQRSMQYKKKQEVNKTIR